MLNAAEQHFESPIIFFGLAIVDTTTTAVPAFIADTAQQQKEQIQKFNATSFDLLQK